ncbi:hypothetical protein M422DRAFT_270370 [Sphaerobolus stellatus SS14]|uniref:Secreted protein n=1 Tax=Sphaerobolus stellatus (strain SS14) TaxID=990650 RepID=A0A0C9UT57_SPHS4|nr:hypothetical protein M422DRAFT_270370 [Sphaerobolus stellatus SS14]
MTSQACHWLAVFATLAVWRTRCSCDLVPVATVRPHKKALSDSTLHVKSMRNTAESRSLPTPLRAAPATTFPWLVLEHRDYVSTLRPLQPSIQDSVSHRPIVLLFTEVRHGCPRRSTGGMEGLEASRMGDDRVSDASGVGVGRKERGISFDLV